MIKPSYIIVSGHCADRAALAEVNAKVADGYRVVSAAPDVAGIWKYLMTRLPERMAAGE